MGGLDIANATREELVALIESQRRMAKIYITRHNTASARSAKLRAALQGLWDNLGDAQDLDVPYINAVRELLSSGSEAQTD